MLRTDSKSGGKHAKNARLLESLKSYRFLMLCLLAHLYTLLLVSVSAEFETAQYHELVATYVALGTVLVLGLSRAMRWSWPLFIEDTLIIIFLWALLSILFGTYTVCNQSGTVGGAGVKAVVVHQVSDTAHADQDSMQAWLQHYRAMASSCDTELFNAMYSLLVLVLLLCAVLVDLRNYWVSVLFGVATGVLLLGAVLVPTNCSRFQLLDLNTLLLKVTLYNLVWYLNHHRRVSEEVVANNYALAMRSLGENLRALADTVPLRHKHARLVAELDDHSVTPVQLFERLRRLCHYLQQWRQRALPERVTSTPSKRGGTIGGLDASDDESSSSEEAAELAPADESLEARIQRGRLVALREQSAELRKLQRVNNAFYTDTWFVHWLSWKNRAYSRHMMRMIDLARTAWILFVCPWFLLAVAVEVVWLLWHIRVNEAELQATAQMTELTRLYGEKRGDLSEYT